jgi:hypothetical protein
MTWADALIRATETVVDTTPWVGLASVAFAAATATVGYFERKRIQAAWDFTVKPSLAGARGQQRHENFEVRLIEVNRDHVDIDSDDLTESTGISYNNRLRKVPRDQPAEMDVVSLDPESESLELILISLRFDGLVNFRPLTCWVHFWPPDRIRIVGPDDIDDPERTLPDLGSEQTELHQGDAWVRNSHSPPTYDNIAYQYTDDKRLAQIRRGSARFVLDHYTPGHNIFVPVWVDIPADPVYPEQICDPDDQSGDSDLAYHGLRVVIDPPGYPQVDEEFNIRLDVYDDADRAAGGGDGPNE